MTGANELSSSFDVRHVLDSHGRLRTAKTDFRKYSPFHWSLCDIADQLSQVFNQINGVLKIFYRFTFWLLILSVFCFMLFFSVFLFLFRSYCLSVFLPGSGEIGRNFGYTREDQAVLR